MKLEIIENFKTLEVRQQWLTLQARSSCSFFQTWHWVGPWLDHVCTVSDTVLIRFLDEGETIGLGFLEKYTHIRRGIFKITVSTLNESIRPKRYMCSEYNFPVCIAGYEDKVFDALRSLNLSELGSDELHIRRAHIPCKNHINNLLEDNNCLLESEMTWGIDLKTIGHGVNGVIAGLKKKRRWQIRKSIEQYDKEGGFKMQLAGSKKEAIEFFHGLDRLHTMRWVQVGKVGTFANSLRKAFIIDVIKEGFDKGVIQLIKFTAGERSVGFLLNFVWQKTVYVLQSGFDLKSNRVEMPGYLSHIYATDYNRSIGHTYYDFMSGESLYKTLLSNTTKELYDITYQCNSFKIRAENSLLSIYRRLRR
jgi:CelD/BcsL family acetyltransferase involved in cellulose biosynthesis